VQSEQPISSTLNAKSLWTPATQAASSLNHAWTCPESMAPRATPLHFRRDDDDRLTCLQIPDS
jgi:hypothetical protein